MIGSQDPRPTGSRRAEHERGSRRASPAALLLSFALVGLVGLAVAGTKFTLFLAIVSSTLLAVTALHWLFPASRLLWIAFVNLVAVYASIFALFVDDVFARVDKITLSVGFILPIVFFVIGCWRQRAVVAAIVTNPEVGGERRLLRAFTWLVPVGAVGVAVIILARFSEPMVNSSMGFLVAMFAIGLLVLAASRDVAIFLVDTGLLFDEFFDRVGHLLVPAFAFLTVYSLLLLVFASLFCLLSRFDLEPHFRIGSEARALSFSEALHFSVVTLSTVGYGDIVPITALARTMAAIEVVLGTLLLLFGVSEMLAYAKDRRRPHKRDRSD